MSDTQNSSALYSIAEIGLFVSLVIVFLWFGAMKFTAYEAEAINGLVANSPFIGFMTGIFDQYTLSKIIGSVEIVIALLLLARFFMPKLAVIGGLLAAATFLLTSSFFLSTPGVFLEEIGAGAISVVPGQFLLKDIVLFFASVWAAANASAAANRI